MNQAEIRKLIPALRMTIRSRKRNFGNKDGPEGRLIKMRKTVTELVKNERIELYHNRGDEARGYAERLIGEAIKNGDCHRPTMELATYWLEDKQLVHKLFKVLVPRFKDSKVSYTRMLKAPNIYPGNMYERVVLELRGNPFPPLDKPVSTRNWIHNVLIEEAHRDYNLKLAEKIEQNKDDLEKELD